MRLSTATTLAGLLSLWAAPQSLGQPTPCGIAIAGSSHGLVPVEGGLIYDSTQKLCWLADANPAGNPIVRSMVSLSPLNGDLSFPVINPDGTMDWATALNFVSALNGFNGGRGWLSHNNWRFRQRFKRIQRVPL
jgi:hypothetical protein